MFTLMTLQMSMEVTVETWRFNFFSKLVDRRLWDNDFSKDFLRRWRFFSQTWMQTTCSFWTKDSKRRWFFHSPLIRFFIFVFHSQSVGEINTELKNNTILLSFKKELFGAKKQLQLFGAKNDCFFFLASKQSICCSTNFLGEPQRTK